jgi:hypothetical protein
MGGTYLKDGKAVPDSTEVAALDLYARPSGSTRRPVS